MEQRERKSFEIILLFSLYIKTWFENLFRVVNGKWESFNIIEKKQQIN